MATIYSAPENLKPTKLSFTLGMKPIDFINHDNAYIEKLSEWCKKRNPNDPDYIGEVISFPVADGRALYMVAALKPLQLIHVEVGDAYGFEYAHKLNKKDVMAKVDNAKKLKEMFGKKQK